MDAPTNKAVSEVVLALRELAKGRPLTLFIDPLLANPFAEMEVYRSSISGGGARIVKLPRIHADVDPARTPYLLHISDEVRAEHLINESVEWALCEAGGELGPEYRGRSVCGWICGEHDPIALARRLASAARVIKPSGDPWPLRYWDPRVIWHLPRALVQGKWCVLQNWIGEWCSIGPHGNLALYGAKKQALSPAMAETQGIAMRFDTDEWRRLERIGTINNVFALAQDWGVTPNIEQAHLIDSLLIRCEAWGYKTEQDKLVFAACALTSHVDFDKYPAIAEAMQNGARNHQSLQAALARFNDDQWQHISQGSWQPARWAAHIREQDITMTTKPKTTDAMQKAATQGCSNDPAAGCTDCNKSGLAILPVVPTLLPNSLRNLNAELKALDGHYKAEDLKAHWYVMRTLPAGYLYVLKPDMTWDGYAVDTEGLLEGDATGSHAVEPKLDYTDEPRHANAMGTTSQRKSSQSIQPNMPLSGWLLAAIAGLLRFWLTMRQTKMVAATNV